VAAYGIKALMNHTHKSEYSLSQSSYQSFAVFLHQKLGILLGDNRQYLVKSRLSSVAHHRHYTNFDVFLNDLISIKDSCLTDQCLELMTTNETFWFRDGYPFNLLMTHILPKLHKKQNSLRIWSSACASGQEAYSIAMIIADYQTLHPRAFSGGIEILATDFSQKMIAATSCGVYSELALGRGLDDKHKQQYFEPALSHHDKQAMLLKPQIKKMVKAKRFNLLNDFSTVGKFDVIFCRNVLIYFDGNQKASILKKFAACLPTQGVLMLGAAESIAGAETSYKMESYPKGLYYARV
jgi:chemotaxis protein methyltransferase CheR